MSGFSTAYWPKAVIREVTYGQAADPEWDMEFDGQVVTVINSERVAYALPATGGEGTRRIMLAGILLICIAGVGLFMIRRRREMTR